MVSPQPSARQISVEILEDVFNNGLFADELVARVFQQIPLKNQDRTFIMELVNGTVRWRGQLDWILAKYFRGNFNNSPIKLRSILELTLYQIKFLDKVPNYAAVSEGVELAKNAGGTNWGNLVNGVLRNYLRQEKLLKFPALKTDPVKALSIRYSHPQWLVQRWLSRFGLEDTKQLCEINNRRPEIAVRVNLKKASREGIIKEFNKSGVRAKFSKYFRDFIKISKPHDLTKFSAFIDGLISIQDESTAIASLLLAPAPGDVVLDMCAAPGGKTCHLAELMTDTGKVIAVDRNLNRLKLLIENRNRLKINSIIAVVADSTKIALPKVDKILVDAPCSGSGVLSKRSDLRWKRKLEDIFKIKNLQKTLLENASQLLKSGGILVYSTCTLEPEENEEVVEEFLIKHKNYKRIPDSSLINKIFSTSKGYWASFPHKHHIDGVFAAKLMKIN